MDKEAILSNRLYVPKYLVTDDHKKRFEYTIGNDNEYGCEELITTYKRIGDSYGFCRGNMKKIYKVFRDFEIEDQRSIVPLSFELDFLGRLYKNQRAVQKAWLQYLWGVLEAPPRFGKTVVLCSIVCELQQKTLIMAHQIDLLEQFLKTFYKFTNIQDVERMKGKQLIGIVNKPEDLDRFEICLSTWQAFVTGKGGKKALKKHRDSFGLVVVDEAHKAAAPCYSYVCNRLNSMARVGVTATPKRKDELQIIMHDVLGPVVAVGEANQLMCRVKYIHTQSNPGVFHQWHTFIKRLVSDKARNQQIVDRICKDLKRGHSVIAVTDRKAHTLELANWVTSKGFKAEAFNGSTAGREKVLQRARDGETRAIFSMRSMVLGLDVPRWSAFHNCLPSANPHNFYQEFSRIRTPFPAKDDLPPVIRDYIDQHKAAYACKNIRHRVYKEQGCEFDE